MSRRNKAFLALVLVLLGIQLLRPTRTNPPVDPQRELAAHSQLPPQVASALNRSCNDCHSYRTTWPWYSQIAPFSWVITDDVNQGRRHVNFSDWGQYDPKRADHKLDQICEEVRGNWMPSNVLQTCCIRIRGLPNTSALRFVFGWERSGNAWRRQMAQNPHREGR